MSLEEKICMYKERFNFISRRKTQSKDFRKDSGDLVQATIIIASLVVASIVTVGGVSVASQQKAKSTAICINEATNFSQNANSKENCQEEAEEIQHSTEETIDEIFGGGNTGGGSGVVPTPGEEVLECVYDESTEEKDRQELKQVYFNFLMLGGNSDPSEALANMESELEEIFGDRYYIYNINYDMATSGELDSEKISEALEVSRKYIDQQSIFSWTYANTLDGKAREDFEALSEIKTTLWILEANAEAINNYPEVFQSGTVEFVIEESNFTYYGDSARLTTEDIWRDKSKDVFKVYVDGEEVEDYYMSGRNKSIHYDERFALSKSFIKENDCTWKLERAAFYRMPA